jgi:hypothetical protein
MSEHAALHMPRWNALVARRAKLELIAKRGGKCQNCPSTRSLRVSRIDGRPPLVLCPLCHRYLSREDLKEAEESRKRVAEFPGMTPEQKKAAVARLNPEREQRERERRAYNGLNEEQKQHYWAIRARHPHADAIVFADEQRSQPSPAPIEQPQQPSARDLIRKRRWAAERRRRGKDHS